MRAGGHHLARDHVIPAVEIGGHEQGAGEKETGAEAGYPSVLGLVSGVEGQWAAGSVAEGDQGGRLGVWHPIQNVAHPTPRRPSASTPWGSSAAWATLTIEKGS